MMPHRYHKDHFKATAESERGLDAFASQRSQCKSRQEEEWGGRSMDAAFPVPESLLQELVRSGISQAYLRPENGLDKGTDV